jgi:nucleotide-binding universal stress UspA family protein
MAVAPDRAKRRVVVGYDASPDADRALEWAIEYAAMKDLLVEVLSCAGDLTYVTEDDVQLGDELVDDRLKRAADRLQRAEGVEWNTSSSPGRIVPELVEASHEAAVIVVGAQGHSGLGGFVLGSVSQHVTRHAACPVVVARAPRTPDARRIVVGVDGSDEAHRALGFAFDVAESQQATVVALHAHVVKAVNGPWDIVISPEVAQEMEAAQRWLAEVVAGFRQDRPEVAVELAPTPVPAARALSDASATASLVVVGTRGRGGFAGLLLGSVGSTVLHHAQCTVAVVR